MLLVAPNERKVWIATGYGAGGFLTDAMSGVIIREAILPHFKQSPPDYGGGIEAGADAIIKQMSLPPEEAQKNVAAAQQAQQQRQHSGGNPLPVIFWSMVFGFVALSIFRRGNGRRYRTRRAGSARGSCCGASTSSAAARAAAGAAAPRGAAAAGAAVAVGGWRRLLRRRRIVRRRRRRGKLVMPRCPKPTTRKCRPAITAAEATSSGEIVAVATPISDAYHDVALHWALVPLFAVLAWAAWRPTALTWWYDFLFGGWQPDPTQSQLLTLLMVFAALKFTVALLILKWMPLRLSLTPARDKASPCAPPRDRHVQGRCRAPHAGRTGILIYLSIAERRAEIIADEAILKVTDEHTWGEAMTALIADVRKVSRRRNRRRGRARRRGAFRAFPALGARTSTRYRTS